MDELQALYESAYARLVGVVGAVCGDTDLAQEAVQEAFVRLTGRWERVSACNDPEAWLRKVALGKVATVGARPATGSAPCTTSGCRSRTSPPSSPCPSGR